MEKALLFGFPSTPKKHCSSKTMTRCMPAHIPAVITIFECQYRILHKRSKPVLTLMLSEDFSSVKQ